MVCIAYKNNVVIIGELVSNNRDTVVLKNPLRIVLSKEGAGFSTLIGDEKAITIKYDMLGEVSKETEEMYKNVLAELKAKRAGIDLDTPRNPKVVKELFNKN